MDHLANYKFLGEASMLHLFSEMSTLQNLCACLPMGWLECNGWVYETAMA